MPSALPVLEVEITADPTSAVAGFGKVAKAQQALEDATQSYQNSLISLQKAERQGLVTADAYAKAIDDIESEYRNAAAAAAGYAGATTKFARTQVNAAGAMRGLSRSSDSAAASSANLAAQFNDIGVMLAAGQNGWMLALQQGTQINQVLTQMGGGQAALRGVAAGIASMINPMSLATIGIIAGGAALVQFGVKALGATEDTKKLKKELEEIREGMETASREVSAMRLGVSTEELRLIEEIAQARENLTEKEIALEKARGVATKGARGNLAAARDALAAAEQELEKFRLIRAERERLEEADKRRQERSETHIRQMAEIFRTAQEINREVAQSNRHAKEAADLRGIEAAYGKDSVQYMRAMQGHERAALEDRIKSAGYSEEMANKLRDSLGYAQEISALEMSSGIENAATAAKTLADQFGIAYTNALDLVKLQNASIAGAGGLGFGAGVPTGQATGLGFGSGSNMGAFGPGGAVRNQSLIQIPERSAVSGGGSAGRGGGGGGGGVTLADQLEDLRQALASERQILEAEHQERNNLLKSAFEQRLISQQEFEALSMESAKRYREGLEAIDGGYHGSTLARTQAFFGDMASAFSQGNEKMLKISQAFGAAEALINAWRAYAQVLADPGASFLQKFAQATSVFSAAMGAVNAIKGVSAGGGGSSGGGGTAGGGAVQRVERVATINFGGNVGPNEEQLANVINNMVADGFQIGGVNRT